ncbi:hypothetical protein AB0I22_24820 [Streptomyces sp. NPDC050610]|uniref:phosphorylase family protein n=1 Tax=Streptomyces sp. NPDC050610 TaxID=3157097 RepID=UPI003426ABE5
MPTVLVLTALEEEYEAVRRRLDGVSEIELSRGTRLDTGRVPGLPWRIALAETGPTNTQAALVAQHAVEELAAQAVLFVGVAGSLRDDLRLGDVLVASKVYGYHGGRESKDGFSARPAAWEPSYKMDQLVRSARRNDPWAFLTRPSPPHELASSESPKVHYAPLAAGDVVIDSRDSETFRRIRRHYNDAVAVDMESHGVAQAVRMFGELPMVTVRGISDLGNGGKEAADTQGYQPLAARHAAAFALRVLRELRPLQTPLPHEERGHSCPTPVVAPRPAQTRVGENWTRQPVVRIQECEYLLYDEDEDLLRETLDGAVIRRQAKACVVSGRPGRDLFVWLRQVELSRVTHDSDRDALAALEREAELCRELRGPEVVQLSCGGGLATLALRWPSGPGGGRPADTLREMLPDPSGRQPDRLRLFRTVEGLVAVAEALDRLHGQGLSHRALQSTAVVLGRPRMVLRDLGLAAFRPRRGEHAGPYQAPEQKHGSRVIPGPATDVYQLGALLHSALTGRTPVPGMPPYSQSAQVPPSLVGAMRCALEDEPADRPDLCWLRRELTTAARELSAVPGRG